MDHKFFLSAISNFILRPEKAWDIAISENKPDRVLNYSLLIPLVVLITLSSFAGSLIFSNAELGMAYSVLTSLKSAITLVVTLLFSAILLKETTYPLDLGRNYTSSIRLIVYSSIPFICCQLISKLFESFLFINILALYGLYIFWVGSIKILNPPGYKRLPLLIATIVITSGIFGFLNYVLSMAVDRFYYSYFS